MNMMNRMCLKSLYMQSPKYTYMKRGQSEIIPLRKCYSFQVVSFCSDFKAYLKMRHILKWTFAKVPNICHTRWLTWHCRHEEFWHQQSEMLYLAISLSTFNKVCHNSQGFGLNRWQAVSDSETASHHRCYNLLLHNTEISLLQLGYFYLRIVQKQVVATMLWRSLTLGVLTRLVRNSGHQKVGLDLTLTIANTHCLSSF